MGKTTNPFDYWAAEDNPQALAENCASRVKSFFDSIRASHHYATIARNWLYYHGLYFDSDEVFDWTAVREISDQMLAAGVNHFRNLIEHLFTFVCQQRLSFEARAKQNDTRSFEQAKVAKQVVDHYLREEGLEIHLKRAVRHALVMTSGYVYHPWDIYAGQQIAIPDFEGYEPSQFSDDNTPPYQIVPEGNFTFSNPTVWDVVFDPHVREWERNQWLIIRTFENRFELAAQTDDKDVQKAILDDEMTGDGQFETVFNFGTFGRLGDPSVQSDIISVWNFYHKDSLALPDGCKFRFIGNGEPLGDPEPLPYERLPITRIIPAETLQSQLGYSPANDLQAPQELLNSEVSLIATNHAGAGFSGIWVPEAAELETDDLGDGVFIVRGGQTPPHGISFQANSPDHEKFSNFLMHHLEYLSGVNSVARGQPESNLKSGEALKVMDAKAHQFSSPIKEAYAHAAEDIGTFIARTAPRFMSDDEKRIISITGQRNRIRVGYFKKADLENIDRVVVDISNPTTDTIAGKMWMAEQLLKRDLITTPQEFLTVVQTGLLDPLTQADDAQLVRVHEENDQLARGRSMPINEFTDNHSLHIREHAALITTPERLPEMVAKTILTHLTQHFQAMMRPDVQWAMQALGFPTAPPPDALVGVNPQGIPGAEKQPPPPSGGPSGARMKRNIQGPGEPPQGGPGGNMKRFPAVEPGLKIS